MKAEQGGAGVNLLHHYSIHPTKPSHLSENRSDVGHAYQIMDRKIYRGILRYALSVDMIMIGGS